MVLPGPGEIVEDLDGAAAVLAGAGATGRGKTGDGKVRRRSHRGAKQIWNAGDA